MSAALYPEEVVKVIWQKAASPLPLHMDGSIVFAV